MDKVSVDTEGAAPDTHRNWKTTFAPLTAAVNDCLLPGSVKL